MGRAPHTRVCGRLGVGDTSCECEDVTWPFAALWDFDLNSRVYRMSAEAVRVIKGTEPANERDPSPVDGSDHVQRCSGSF